MTLTLHGQPVTVHTESELAAVLVENTRLHSCVQALKATVAELQRVIQGWAK